jgi:hypothetical protein
MSITEQLRAHLISDETYSIITASALIAAMLLLPSEVDKSLVAPPQPTSYYKALEASDSSFPACKITTWDNAEKPGYRAKTDLGERLIALRNQAISNGLILLNTDEIIEEVHRRRGEAA